MRSRILFVFCCISVLLGQPSFSIHEVTDGALEMDYTVSIFAIDMDGDGDMDMVAASYSDDRIAWYENNGSESFTYHIISNNVDEAWGVYAIDFDSDGDIDALSASHEDDKIAWYENNGSESFTAVSYTHLTLPTICSV